MAAKHFLVVGGAGYIGSHVVRAFLDRGDRVTVFDDLSSGKQGNLFPEANFVEGSIIEPEALAACLSGGTFDGAVHLAAFKAAGESMTDPMKFATNNLCGTVNVLNALVAAGVKRLVFSSSAAVYGEPKYVPMDEQHPTEPENFYGFSKLEMERVMAWYDRLMGVRFAALRYFNAAGFDPAGRIRELESSVTNLLPVIMEVASGRREKLQVFGTDYDTPDGSGVRDYIHVSDLASGHLAAMDQLIERDESLTVNLGTGQGTSVLEMLDVARRISGQDIKADMCPRRIGDPSAVYAKAERAEELLGWTARYSDVVTLVESTWKVYRKQ